MMFSKILGLATVFAGVASALPAPAPATAQIIPRSSNGTSSGQTTGGGVTIVNNLGQDLYAWSVSDQADSTMHTLSANGGTYSETWQTNPNGGGVSIKLATEPEQTDVLQYEYTLSSDTIFWDLSCINMGTSSEFTSKGFAVTSDDGSCPTATCAPGDKACADAYLIPTDDHATHGCPSHDNFVLNIGSNGN
ncbi:extracellular thaumatin domain protein, putative [Paecilomyces variotii No. 5]|uniref:Extracellular thaumatin domain protein, putative n=1 Tax=Byssochlamys spectabilis (strain No. 5 / NBRC 109023) TaxID=1356009 RepID=V5G7C4_BYSSN|nr:extracellular thaumatin domain protein, putative [Paecilomyces variotii No. 5]